ncbi:30S ribosomal protein S1 [Lactococcus petauri]|uniref:30S ribosomal protein S1 n=1 Tax=Lactococcus petauri TaxID=1940789 RepID=UPI00156FCE80|nr:30S ribosomal protein S1 [Lactococcus petauri]MDC0815540.1 30S ribosomal protein S1 [Lactococcus petauri]MDC0817582.1 30S ribosomal protein S1 [Lactococcus petauri]MDC0823758.1 30S ribosomal protein S1 [Lactococcus petauri]MDC0830247.1 30S ribosomal protein S1 [Lactococcus petauri]NSL26487.1 30S ribosomal protein S1 [Lactococcus petauri]
MNEFETLLNSVEDVKVRDVVKGEILTIENGQATVAIVGTGVEGVLTLREITNDRDADINTFVKPGDILDLLVIKQIVGKDAEGANVYLLSLKRLEARKAWTELEGKEGEILTVKVTKDVKGGLSVDYNGVRGFIPASMIDTYFVKDTKKFVGQEIEAKIIEINASENRFILSRRAVVEAETIEMRKEAFAQLNEGDIVEGTVSRVTNFGAFVDLGGIDGLVHVSELSHNRVKRPSDVVKPGDKVEVKILKLDEEAGRLSLSLKATQAGPWEQVEEKAPVGSTVEGTVKRLTDFGAFVELFPGVEGLVHVSQISWERVENPKDVLKVGQVVNVKVLDVKPEEERISLSIKALEEAPARNNEDGEKRDRKPRAPRKAAKPSYDLPETQEGFSLADFLGEDFDINDL